MVLAAGCVGAKAEQLPTMRRADRMARRKRFILAFIRDEEGEINKYSDLVAKNEARGEEIYHLKLKSSF